MPRPAGLALPSDPLDVQIQNKVVWNESRSVEDADFFTIGYMRRGVDQFAEILMAAGVSTLIDVRQYAVSMYKPEFSKTNLQRHLAERGIGYLHVPALGVPKDVRGKAIGQPNRDGIWEWYDRYVVAQFIGRSLTRFLNFAEHPVALMCVELDPGACHRHRLSLALEHLGLRGYDL